MTLLVVQDLAVSRGGLRTVEGVGFSLDAGQALILRGPNGLGKTTLLRCIAGLQPPAAGRIVIEEDSLAYAAHADGLKSALTVAENMDFWARVFGGGDVAAALAAMDLQALAHRPAGALSAGQKRRLGLARLLVARRPIWVLDEPTVSLDAASVARFAGVIGDHLAQGGAALIATHIDLGLPQARVQDLTPFRARPGTRSARPSGFNEAFA
ncbi:heme ABC exporter ATP-binding protein CcmA [Paracoccus aestuarii]|uniref:Heme ABC exporter ATP-binding protein CcmA n=1 Tax=Paracoccus aestuarii TaxID=453842 RepID=A0A419A0M4_9RHOB|nr:heme ABC exporter ATP-binding protein CcmA [Paracoccus aestuarii]RJL06349.1 heme ABC exporter ATP-binding protein CcmA [Paracoccus aestuarii]WCR00130.1 heme ABC exporter ATP-binding protein CcmA [Paracoccus aestuarii]